MFAGSRLQAMRSLATRPGGRRRSFQHHSIEHNALYHTHHVSHQTTTSTAIKQTNKTTPTHFH